MRRDQRSAAAAQYRALYNSKAWKALKAHQRAKQPLCEWCQRQDRVTPMYAADHVKPHRGDETLFFDPDNLQSLCKTHHDSTKQGEEKRGFGGQCDASGWPTDPRHPANRT